MTDAICSSFDADPAVPRALVIGAAGCAGQAFAMALHRRGAEVIVADRDEVGLARLRQDLSCTAIALDALEDGDVDALFDEIESWLGSVDLLINVAGRGYVRTLAMMRTSRAFARRERERAGYIVNVAAPGGADDSPITYAGSEVAFDRLSQGLGDTIGNPLIKVLTLPRLDSRDAFDDISDRLVNEWRRAQSAVGGSDGTTVD